MKINLLFVGVKYKFYIPICLAINNNLCESFFKLIANAEYLSINKPKLLK